MNAGVECRLMRRFVTYCRDDRGEVTAVMSHYPVAVIGIDTRDSGNIDILLLKRVIHLAAIGKHDRDHRKTTLPHLDASFAHIRNESSVRLLEQLCPTIASSYRLDHEEVLSRNDFKIFTKFGAELISQLGSRERFILAIERFEFRFGLQRIDRMQPSIAAHDNDFPSE